MQTLERYIEEVYYFEPEEAIKDIIALLDGSTSLENLRQTVSDAHIADEAEHGDGMYKTGPQQ